MRHLLILITFPFSVFGPIGSITEALTLLGLIVYRVTHPALACVPDYLLIFFVLGARGIVWFALGFIAMLYAVIAHSASR